MPTPVICRNSFSTLKDEPLYESRLNLGLDNPVPRPMRRFCISAVGIESPTTANLPLTRTCQSSEPAPECKCDNITSKAPKHKGVVFAKSPPKTHNISPWPEVAKIVRGLGIPCEDNDFHCPMDCHIPENHIENLTSNLETEPAQQTKLLVKLLSQNAKLPTRGSDNAAGYDLYSCESMILEPGTSTLLILASRSLHQLLDCMTELQPSLDYPLED